MKENAVIIKSGLMLLCLMILVAASLSITADGKMKVSDLRSVCRWTDSRYITAQADGGVIVNNNAHLSQWPCGHDVRLYADWAGRLSVTYYPAPVGYHKTTIQ